MREFYLIENRNLVIIRIKKTTFKEMKKQNYNIFKDFISALNCLYIEF